MVLKPTDGIIEILWCDGESQGTTELIPLGWVANAPSNRPLAYAIRLADGSQCRAMCQLERGDRYVDLDYLPYATFNTKWGILLGVMRLLFEDPGMTALREVQWKGIDDPSFAPANVTLSVSPLPDYLLTPYRKVSSKGKLKTVRPVTERPGQVRFRKVLLDDAYAGSCCISACTVPEVLEAAHIDPFDGPAYDDPRNGLLLRRDLHALFDANLLGIEPKTHRVHFHSTVTGWQEYRRWHKRVRLIPPVFGPIYAPSEDALVRRWEKFKQRRDACGTNPLSST